MQKIKPFLKSISLLAIITIIAESNLFAQDQRKTYMFSLECRRSVTRDTPANLRRKFLNSPAACQIQLLKKPRLSGASPITLDRYAFFKPNFSRARSIAEVSYDPQSDRVYNLRAFNQLYSASIPFPPLTIEGGTCSVTEGYPIQTLTDYQNINEFNSDLVPIRVVVEYVYKCVPQ